MTSSLTRRELLAAFLGAPAAMAACRSGASPLPPGSIIFPSQVLGHKVRDGIHASPSIWENKKVVIVGGGIAGLTVAWRFLRSGFEDFVLLELDEVPGGTAKSGKNDVSAYPWGAHYITLPMKENGALLSLLSEVGVVIGTDDDGNPTVDESYLCREPAERLFYRGRWYPGLYLHEGESAEDRSQLARFQSLIDTYATMRDDRGRRAFALPVCNSSDDPLTTALDRISVAEWLRQNAFTSTRLLWMVDYACRDDYGSTPAQTSAWAGVFYFASRLERPGQEAQSVITWPEGNGRLVALLGHRVVGERIRSGVAAYDIVPTAREDREGVDVHALSEAGTKLIGFHADHVVFAAPQFVARAAIRPYRDAPPAFLDEFTYGAWMVANLTLSRRLRSRGFPFAWDNVLYESPSLGYVVATHQSCIDHGPTVLTYYYPLVDEDTRLARSRLLSLGRDQWAEIVLSDIERAHPEVRESVTRLDVTRWGHAMIRPRVGLLWGGARAKAAQPLRNIHFAGTDLSGVALFEEAFAHGIRAAEEVLERLGRRMDPLR